MMFLTSESYSHSYSHTLSDSSLIVLVDSSLVPTTVDDISMIPSIETTGFPSGKDESALVGTDEEPTSRASDGLAGSLLVVAFMTSLLATISAMF